MATYSAEIQSARMRFTALVTACMQTLVTNVASYSTTLRLKPGWDIINSLSDLLKATRRQDTPAGFTRFGPHRADLVFSVDDRDISTSLSRGQTKLYVVLLAIAVSHTITELGGESPVLLLDDPGAELDLETLASLIRLISDQPCQSVVSLPGERSQLCEGKDVAVFHVERGDIRKMIRCSDL